MSACAHIGGRKKRLRVRERDGEDINLLFYASNEWACPSACIPIYRTLVIVLLIFSFKVLNSQFEKKNPDDD